MTPTNITLSQAVRFARAQAPAGGTFYIRDLVKGLEERYGFLQVPSRVEEFDLSTGLSFFHGTFEGQFVIERFQVFENGVLCLSKGIPTRALDHFIDDAFAWAQGSLGLNIEPFGSVRRSYLSNIEFRSDFQINDKLQKFADVGRTISKFLGSYGISAEAQYGLSGITFSCDLSLVAAPQPTSLTFERRAGHRFSENIYFSSAPLSTDDHHAILEMLEKLFMA